LLDQIQFIYGTSVINGQRYAVIKDDEGFVVRIRMMASPKNGLFSNEIIWQAGDEMIPFILDILEHARYPQENFCK